MSNTTIAIDNPPHIDGLVFRRLRDDGDYAHLAELMNQSWAADGVQKEQTAETVAAVYRPSETFDPCSDVVVVESPDGPIGFSRVRHGRETGGARVYYLGGHVLPDWRRHGIGDALLRHGEGRLREIAATHPDDGPKLFESTVLSEQLGGIALMAKHGYQPTPELELQDMVRPTLDDPPAAELPAGWRSGRSARRTGVGSGSSMRPRASTDPSRWKPVRTSTSSGPRCRSGTTASGRSPGTAASRSGWC